MTETTSTNKIGYFERRFVSLETAVYSAAEDLGIPTRHFLNGIGNQDIHPEVLVRRMAEQIKELREALEAKPVEPEVPKLKFSPTIEQVIDNTVRRFLIPRAMDGVTKYRVFQEKIVQIDAHDNEVAIFPIGHLALKKTFTEDEWNHLKLEIRQKVAAHYETEGLTDGNPEDVHNL